MAFPSGWLLGHNLRRGTAPVPLKSINIQTNICDFTSSTCISHLFLNEEEDPLEVTFEYPLEENAAVGSFTAVIDGKKIEGCCKEKEKASNEYSDAIASGHGAYLMREEGGLLKLSIGNLPSKKEALIEITYYKELEVRGSELIFSIPVPNASVEQETCRPQHSTFSSSLIVTLDMTSNINSISSSTHPIAFEFGDQHNRANVKVSDKPGDFELGILLEEPHRPCCRVQMNDKGQKCAMVALYPHFDAKDEEAATSELIFVVDRSGSMSGSKMKQVIECLQVFLRSLPEGTLFNIVSFGTDFKLLFPDGSVIYNEENLQIAAKHVKDMSADFGGTNILKPLENILTLKPKPGVPRQIFLLTDGEVANWQECVDAVRLHSQTTRVFTFGIGSGASKQLVQGIAKAGEGFCEMISSTTTTILQQKVLNQLARALKPALTELKANWSTLEKYVTQAPYRLPLLFSGSRLVIYAFISEGAENGEISITARAGTKEVKFAAEIKPDATSKGDEFHKLAAKKLIRDLEDKRSYLHDDAGNLLPSKTSKEVDDQILQLSTTYNILSKLTSFVAVEKREEATEGTLQLREMSLLPPSTPGRDDDFGGPVGDFGGPVGERKRRAGKRKRRETYEWEQLALKKVKKQREKRQSSSQDRDRDRAETPERNWRSRSRSPQSSIERGSMEDSRPKFVPRKESTKPQKADEDRVYSNCILTQKANGSWTPGSNEVVVSTKLEEAYPKSAPIKADPRSLTVWATAIMIAFITTRFPDKSLIWALVVDKARKWLRKEIEQLGSSFEWEKEAAEYVSHLPSLA
eukprot:TRINITY_DN2587_c0_g1_i1.p1 TRINITY_DN2587_c0_g1~~TRINITY_DN2587_c0_g1_i1.p1  ORF type:complete len:806 (-),score=163.68 TRINITY_DN2587_c0_g1_i1:1733-4150(-)